MLKNRRYLMRRMMVIGITICLVLLATVGTGAAAAQQKLAPPFRVVQYDVTYHNEVVGKLIVNTNDWTYVMNAHGLDPDTEYFFYCLGRYPPIANATSNEGGDLHMAGTWDPETANVADSSLTQKFIVSDAPLMGSVWYSHIDAYSCNPLYLWFTVWGQLYYLSDDDEKIGIPDQTLAIYVHDKETGQYTKLYGIVTTDENGEFSLTKAFSSPKYDPMVSYSGNADRSYSFTYATYVPQCPVK
jgi:hypothetical protein